MRSKNPELHGSAPARSTTSIDRVSTDPGARAPIATSGGAGWFLVIMAALFAAAIVLGLLTG